MAEKKNAKKGNQKLARKLSALIDAINNIDTVKDQHLDLKADTATRDNAKLSLRRSQSVGRPRSGGRFMANPPFNLKDWRAAGTAMRDCPDLATAGNPQAVRKAKNNVVHDGRWNGYETPPTERSTRGKRVGAQLPKVRMPSLGYPPIHWKSCL